MSIDIDPVELARDLIRCPSVTPVDAGALGVLRRTLERIGFHCHQLRFGTPGTPDVENLYARFGRDAGPNFCFAGHTDVVPIGDASAWKVEPFGAELRDGRLYGRGAADMKGAIAAFVAAAARFIAQSNDDMPGAVSLLITGDEEGPAVNGTKRVLEWLRDRGERLDACIVGEPTNPGRLGEMVKIGRRGSMNVNLRVRGTQGHTAYPQLADNPIHRLVRMLTRITERSMDDGSRHFQPSTLQVSTIDVGNPASNVIPAEARASFNIRFNDRHSSRSIEKWLRSEFDDVGGVYELQISVSGESFLTPPGPLSELVVRAVQRVLGQDPEFSTTGGTSDARFIKAFCPVVEFGLTGSTMHKVDENVPVADIHALSEVYFAILQEYFGGRGAA